MLKEKRFNTSGMMVSFINEMGLTSGEIERIILDDKYRCYILFYWEYGGLVEEEIEENTDSKEDKREE